MHPVAKLAFDNNGHVPTFSKRSDNVPFWGVQ